MHATHGAPRHGARAALLPHPLRARPPLLCTSLLLQALPKVGDILIGINIKVFHYQSPQFAALRKRVRSASMLRRGAMINIEVPATPALTSRASPVVGSDRRAAICAGRWADLHRVRR